ncbi:hypothetical protein [Methanocella arvoryzae]|uniref:Uncharacterized protein n=1 Tax=Methanocella arvoryzae (strain DSM 22066 / NBRC 105507 / MRE50) TaxID=351160 RepID=Q0W636_METAR|nr:hypothetical protein [Methanocella arvoryzae]CAJ36157.1 hypothetical protein RCIX786 [Methanocella arvoryzae MRE50]
MFKRTASVAMLIMLILSFTVGSVSNTAAYSTVTTVTVTAEPHSLFPGVTMFPGQGAVAVASDRVYAVPAGVSYTTVVVDMESIRLEPQFPGKGRLLEGQTFTPTGAVFLTANYLPGAEAQAVLVGNVMLYEPGNLTPKKFPVRWEQNGSHLPGKPEFIAHVMIAGGGIDAGNRSDIYEFSSKIILDEAALADRAYVISQYSAGPSPYNQAVKAGDDNWHTVNVAEAIDSLDVDLKWEEGDSDLRLMIYTPDGKVLGPYYDDADGAADDRINLNITRSEGLAAGEWYLKVSDTAKIGETDYYVKTS